MLCPSQIKNDIITGLVSNFFNAPCKRVTSSLQKRNHHKYPFHYIWIQCSCWSSNFLMHLVRGWHLLCRKEITINILFIIYDYNVAADPPIKWSAIRGGKKCLKVCAKKKLPFQNCHQSGDWTIKYWFEFEFYKLWWVI